MARHGGDQAERAKDALSHGRFDEAASLLAAARVAPPRDAPSLRTLAAVATVLRDDAATAEWFEAAILAHAPGPAPAAWYRAYGEVCAIGGRLGDAIAAFRATLLQVPEDAETWRWLGRVLRRVDDLPGATAACRRAVELSPGDWPARGDLAVVLGDAGALDEAAALFEELAVHAPDVPALAVARARLDAHCGRRRQAIAVLEACLARDPGNVSVLATLALTLRDEGRFDDSIAASRRAVELAPAESAFWCGLGRTLLEAGRADEALRVAASYLERRPGHAGALSLEVLSRGALGDEASVERLLDYERFVVRRALPLPDGYADLASFNAELAVVTAAHPTLHHAPLRHATAAGLHSGSLLIEPPPAIQSLERALRVAVADYCRALPDVFEHPFVARKPRSWDLNLWCVVMQRGGHQVPHIHPDAWLSGTYYPALPEAIRAGAGPDGWFAFGEPDREFPSRVAPRIVTVRPEEGSLILFPSYFFHRTIPFEADGTRISVAFDVIATA
jgi:uncharacterized protein (TIGR02466 family)